MSFALAAKISLVVWIIIVLGLFLLMFYGIKKRYPNLKWSELQNATEEQKAYFKSWGPKFLLTIVLTAILLIIFLATVGMTNS